MPKPDQRLADPDLDGPDYVALVIEWEAPVDPIEDQVTVPTKLPARSLLARAAALPRAQIAKVFGAIGALALVGWGIHRLRTA